MSGGPNCPHTHQGGDATSRDHGLGWKVPQRSSRSSPEERALVRGWQRAPSSQTWGLELREVAVPRVICPLHSPRFCARFLLSQPGHPEPPKAMGPPAVTLRDPPEPPFWACVCGISARVPMCVSIFCYACFAQRPDSPWGGEEVLGEGKMEDLGAIFHLFGM